MKITIDVDPRKYSALVNFAKENDFNIENELTDTFFKLYEKHVPAPVRVFIDLENTVVLPKSQKKIK